MLIRVLVVSLYLLLVQGAPSIPSNASEPVHWNSKRSLSIRECPRQTTHIAAQAMTEVRTMLARARERLQDFYQHISQPYVQSVSADLDPLLQTTMQTYFSLIDGHMKTKGHPESPDRVKTRERAFKILKLASTMLENLEREPNIEIWCHDRWWKTTDMQGNPPSELLKKQGAVVFDGRSQVAPEEEMNRKWLASIPFWNPHSSPNVMAYTLRTRMAGPFTTVIVLNPARIDLLNDFYTQKNTIAHLKTDLKQPYSYFLSDPTSGWDMTVVLLHELTHTWDVATPSQWLGDTTKLEDGTTAADVDRWTFATRLAAEEPSAAAENADNFTLLVIALYLDKWDWSMFGFNSPQQQSDTHAPARVLAMPGSGRNNYTLHRGT